MAKVIFENINEEFDVADGSQLEAVCEQVGVPFACAGQGVCGSCTVEVVEGMENLSPFTEAEQNFFGEMENERLACQCSIKKGTVKLRF